MTKSYLSKFPRIIEEEVDRRVLEIKAYNKELVIRNNRLKDANTKLKLSIIKSNKYANINNYKVVSRHMVFAINKTYKTITSAIRQCEKVDKEIRDGKIAISAKSPNDLFVNGLVHLSELKNMIVENKDIYDAFSKIEVD